MFRGATIVATKLHRPLPPGPCIPRDRLAARLSAGLVDGCRLILVTAPAGFGKSTLVATWLETRALPWAWLSLEAADNEPRRFLHYLLAALEHIDPAIGAELLPQLLSARPPPDHELLAALVNLLDAQPQPCLLVLDDGQHLRDPQVIAQLTFLLDHSPPSFHLVICSREDPSLPLARLRARRQLLELRQADLRCTPAEAELFLRESMGLALDAAAVEALAERTEGWIAGLQLAGLSLQQHPDPARFVQSFTGSDRYILDYLLDEVYSGQPAEVRELLLRSAVLARFCAPLCDALLAAPGPSLERLEHGLSASLIARLERANLFLIPLDTERRWHRFHHLFADLLRHRLLVERGEPAVAILHRAASGWFEAQGLLSEAVEHARASGDWSFAADLVERHGIALLERSEVPLLAAWCAAFPEPFLRTRPRLCVLLAWTLVLELRRDCCARAEALLQAAEHGSPAGDPAAAAWVAGHAASIRGHMLMADPAVDPAAVIEAGRRGLALLPEDAGPLRSVNALWVAYGYLGLGDVGGALAAFDAAEQLALATGNAYAAVSCAFDRARIALIQGDLRQALAFCAAGREHLASSLCHVAPSLPAAACFDLIEGCVLLEQGDLPAAERRLEAGLGIVGGIQQFAVVGYPTLARLRAAQGNAAGVDAALRRLVQVWPDSAAWAEGLRRWYRLLLAPDDPEARALAEGWATTYVPEPDGLPRLPGIGKSFDEARYGAWLVWARIMVALGRPDRALPLVGRLLDYAEGHGLGGRARELAALLEQATGHGQGAAAPARGVAAPRIPPAFEQDKRLAEPLSERELEVLRLLVEEPGYDMIAMQLIVSPNTVKSHIKHIYEKLAVGNRRQAIARARALGLLP